MPSAIHVNLNLIFFSRIWNFWKFSFENSRNSKRFWNVGQKTLRINVQRLPQTKKVKCPKKEEKKKEKETKYTLAFHAEGKKMTHILIVSLQKTLFCILILDCITKTNRIRVELVSRPGGRWARWGSGSSSLHVQSPLFLTHADTAVGGGAPVILWVTHRCVHSPNVLDRDEYTSTF